MKKEDMIKRRAWSPKALRALAPTVADCLYLVECSESSVGFLWDCHSLSSPMLSRMRSDAFGDKLSWSRLDGLREVVNIGRLGGVPVDVLIMRELIDGIPVGFYCSASSLADHSMIATFVRKCFPGVESTNASNFGQFFSRLEELAALALRESMSAEIASPPRSPRSFL